jgi:hypothetical protein
MNGRRSLGRLVRIALVALALAGATGFASFGDAEAAGPPRTGYWCNRC